MKLHLLTYSYPTNPESSTRKSLDLMVEAAEKRGHTLEIINAKDCKMKFNSKPIVLINNKRPKINVLIAKASFGGTTVDVHGSLIKQFELMGVPVVNKTEAVVCAKNKVATLQRLNERGIAIPKTYIVRSSEYVEEVSKKIGHFPLILKSVGGLAGLGVSIVESKRSLRSIVDMLVEKEDSTPLIMQEYIRESSGKDLRVFIVNGKIVAAMDRVAKKRGEFRSNFSLGGKIKIAALTTKEKNIARAAAKAVGLDYTGVDVIRTKNGPKILEVNANPGLEGITKATNVDVAGAIIDHAITVAEKAKEDSKTKKATKKTKTNKKKTK